MLSSNEESRTIAIGDECHTGWVGRKEQGREGEGMERKGKGERGNGPGSHVDSPQDVVWGLGPGSRIKGFKGTGGSHVDSPKDVVWGFRHRF